MTQQQAQALTGKEPKYTVVHPNGSTETFDRYIDAAVRSRQVNGTITTHM